MAVAQLVESRIVIPVVVGSSPISHPKSNQHSAQASALGLFAFGSRLRVAQIGPGDIRRQVKEKAFMHRILCWVMFMGLSGCGVMTPASVYEGIRSQQKINADPNIPNPPMLPPYDQYQKEREKSKPTPPQSATP